MAAASECISSGGILQELPDDVLALVSAMMTPQDVVRLSATCKKLRYACSADKLWLPHCERVDCGVDYYSWRNAMDSYRALYRFMVSVRSLVGLWVHQNPELGNLVYVTWGFVSVVGVRIIPQELGPHGLDTGLLWAPVFEIVGHSDGSLAFFLHGRENNKDFCYPGRFHPSSSKPNVLLLEAEPLMYACSGHGGAPRSPNSPLYAETSEDSAGEEFTKRPSKSLKIGGKGKRKNPSEQIPFQRLGFGDRRRLLEKLAPQIALQVQGLASGALFPRSTSYLFNGNKVLLNPELLQRDLLMLAERRVRLLWMYRFGNLRSVIQHSESVPGTGCEGVPSDFLIKHLCSLADEKKSPPKDKEPVKAKLRFGSFKGNGTLIVDNALSSTVDGSKKNSLARFVLGKMKTLIGKNGEEGRVIGSSGGAGGSSAQRLQLLEFLKQSKNIGLRLQATSWKLNFYRAWPIMHNNQFALYKIPEQLPVQGRDYAGLWGGTFGWPPGRPNDEKPGRALFFLLLSYDETDEGRLLIATKILEGTHYVLHPNGSAMFTAKVDDISSEPFPWETGTDGMPVDIVNKFQGEGIANGYGFRYPGSKPGDLFVHSDEVLSFVWRESKAVLTMKRLGLQRLLEKGNRVPALPPVANFAYLTKSHSNVFAGTGGGGPTTYGTLTPRALPLRSTVETS